MNKDKSTTIAFSGHRNNRITTDRQTLAQEIEKLIITYYLMGYRCFMTGMAEGFDLLSAEAVLKLRQTYTDIKLIAVIPFTGQAKYFSDEDKKRYGIIFQQCDESVLITDRYYTGCFHRRNDYLIDHASLLVCYFDGTPQGGTYYTVNRAKSHHLPVVNLMDLVTLDKAAANNNLYKLFVGFRKLGEFDSISKAKQFANNSGLSGAFNLLGKDYSDSWYVFKSDT